MSWAFKSMDRVVGSDLEPVLDWNAHWILTDQNYFSYGLYEEWFSLENSAAGN